MEGYLVKSLVYQALTRAMNLGSLVLTSPSPSLGQLVGMLDPLQEPVGQATKVPLSVYEGSGAQDDVQPGLVSLLQEGGQVGGPAPGEGARLGLMERPFNVRLGNIS